MTIKSGDLFLGLSLGGISLGSLEEKLVSDYKMRKANESEVHLLRQTGTMFASEEFVYLRDQIGLIGPEWDPLVVVKKGKVKMISIQRIVKDEDTKDKVWDDALILYTHELGGPTGKTDEDVTWELSHERKVVLEKKDLFGGTGGRAITIILSCTDPENLPSAT
jgi:hypothetical protein